MGKEIKIEIKSRYSGSVLFSYSCEDNTLSKTVVEAIKSHAELRYADLRDADLRGVALSDANLRSVNLCDADLCNANLRSVALCKVNLLDADLRGANLRDADLRGANLRDANLRGANLCGSDLRDANLCNANLRYTDLRGSDLRDADLRGANLRSVALCNANLRGADLRGADLDGTDLRGADLDSTDLRGAVLSGVDFRGADMGNIKGGYMSCPSEGSFIGWKKATGYIVKLEILDTSRRSSAGGYKCRCDKALVLEIQKLDGSKTDIQTVQSDYNLKFLYTVGTIVEVPDYDSDRWKECAPGIHFFIDRRAAVEYR